MVKTNAERQRDYRRRRVEAGTNGEKEIRAWVSTRASFALGNLARHYGVTKREMVERLILEADQQVTSEMDDQEFDRYLEGPPLRSQS